VTPTSTPADGRRVVRGLVPSQALYVFGSTVDLTLTGIVGAHLAPSRPLATLPFSLIPVVAATSTFALSRWIGRAGYRRVFTVAPAFASAAGLVSALAVQRHLFWLFCAGTGLVGVYQAGSGYYRYAAAEANPGSRARAVSTVLAGGLLAAVVGPFLATGVRDRTATPYVASYLLVALFGAVAVVWNARLPRELVELGATVRRAPRRAAHPAAAEPAASPAEPSRTRRELWHQPVLLVGVGAVALAGVAMTSMMTAGPLAGMDMGHSSAIAALAVQLHLVGMFAPGFVVARWIGRFGERRLALAGALVIVVAGASAASGPSTPAFLVAMTAVGVGWNLAYSGGSAMVAASYGPRERGRVQPIAELLATGSQVAGSLSAGVLATRHGWSVLGLAVTFLSLGVAASLVRGRARPRVGASAQES
jgi:MFS family permease